MSCNRELVLTEVDLSDIITFTECKETGKTRTAKKKQRDQQSN